MIFQRLDEILVEGRAASGRPECAVARMPPRAPRDLTEFGRRQATELPPVEFAVGGEGDVVDIEIEPHADRVGGDDIIDVAVLEHVDLGVSRARRKRAEHNRRPATLAAQEFGDGVDLLGRKGDDGAATRQSGNLALADEAQLREPGALHDRNAGQQHANDRRHYARADQQGLVRPAPVENAVGKDMATVEIGGQLDFIHRHEGDRQVARHGLDGRDPVARVRRLDLFLAGHQRDRVRPGARDELLVNFARQQAQRQADHAGGMAEHALDREMRLAGVGRPQNRRHACVSPRLALDGCRRA